MITTEHTIWTERYRPDTLDGYVGNDTVRSKIEQYINTQDIPHLLFYGTAGTGKCLDESELIDIELDLTEDELELFTDYVVLD